MNPIPFARALGALDEITNDQTTGIAIVTIDEDGKVSARTFGSLPEVTAALDVVSDELFNGALETEEA